MTSHAATGIAGDLAALSALSVPAVRRVRRQWSRRLATSSAAEIHALAVELSERPGWAMRFVGYELIAEHPAAQSRLNARLIERLGGGLDDWGMVDAFGCTITGPAWRGGRLSNATIKRWARSPDRWRRRLALVSTVPLNVKARGGLGDAGRTLAVCTLLIDDRDDMVVKALSWALRSLARRDPLAVRRFLARHDARLAARVRREVGNLLRTGRKS